ncbi:MAG: protein rep [Planctomycetaceae bacterium]|nr:protein rep [Planctomycetaceae bacterium]
MAKAYRNCGKTFKKAVILKNGGDCLIMRHCGTPLCPKCHARRRSRIVKKIAPIIHEELSQGTRLLMVTLTVRHRLSDKLERLMAVLMKSFTGAKKLPGKKAMPGWKRLIKDYLWVRELECTRANGWNPHIHAIVKLTDDFKNATDEEVTQWLRHHWKKLTAEMGFSSTEIKVETLNSNASIKHASDVASYLTKGSMQGREGNKTIAELSPGELNAFCAAFYNKNTYGISKGWKKVLPAKQKDPTPKVVWSDDEISIHAKYGAAGQLPASSKKAWAVHGPRILQLLTNQGQNTGQLSQQIKEFQARVAKGEKRQRSSTIITYKSPEGASMGVWGYKPSQLSTRQRKQPINGAPSTYTCRQIAKLFQTR